MNRQQKRALIRRLNSSEGQRVFLKNSESDLNGIKNAKRNKKIRNLLIITLSTLIAGLSVLATI